MLTNQFAARFECLGLPGIFDIKSMARWNKICPMLCHHAQGPGNALPFPLQPGVVEVLGNLRVEQADPRSKKNERT